MTPISFVFIDGQFTRKQSTFKTLLRTIQFRYHSKHIYLHIPKMLEISQPLQFVFLGKKDYAMECTIVLEEESKMSIFEEYVSHEKNTYHTQMKTHIILHKNARLNFYKLQKESVAVTHSATASIEQAEGSATQIFTLDVGGLNAHHEWQVHLKEKHATCALHGLYILNQDQQNINHHIHVNHEAPFGKSTMFYKGILEQKSRAFFQGRVKVHAKANRSEARQENHHLLLSKDASAKSEPQLEIYADDIQCKHGATVGQLDSTSLFYLRSRGMDEITARQLLIEAFGMEVLNKISDSAVRDYMQREVSLNE